MRKKFLKSAAAFSIAAACIMGGLVPASVGAPVEVAAADVVITDKSDEDLKGLMQSVIDDVIKTSGQVSKDGTTINLKKDGKTVTFGAAADYEITDGTLKDVTITVETTSDKLQVKNNEIALADDTTSLSDEDIEGGIKVTVKASMANNSGDTVNTDGVEITLSKEQDKTPVADDTPLGKAGIASVNVNGGRGTMDITGAEGTQEILVGIGKVNKGKKTITVPSWATYEDEEATVDLSKLSNVKDNYIVLSTPGKDVAIVKIPASHKSIKAKYSVKDGLQVGTSATGGASAAALTNETVGLYQYRTAYSGWNDLELKGGKVDLSLYQEEGAKLFVRLKVAGDETPKVDTTESWTYGAQKDIAVLKACTLPGKETKVSIPAKAKGPKVTADYAKGTVKFPKNSEFRLASTTDIYDDNGKAFGSPTDKVTVAKVYETAKVPAGSQPAEVDIEVRTKETDKKPASKWGRLTIALPAGFATGAIKEGDPDTIVKAEDVKKDEVKEFGGKGVKDSTLKETENGSSVLKMEYAGTAKKPTLKITNSGENAYEFVKEAKGTDKPGDSAKAVKAAKGKTITIKGIKDEDVIFVRVAGDKKKQDWVGAYAKLGSVDVPKTVTGTKTDGATPTPTPTPTPGVTDQQLLQTLADEYVPATKDVTISENYQVIDFLADGKPIPHASWNNAVDYTTGDGKSVTDVTVSVTTISDEAKFTINTGEDFTDGDATPVALTGKTSSVNADDTVNITVSFAKDGCTTVTKTVAVTIKK